MKPYCLTSPDLIGENTVSGGVRVMWGLFGWLLAKGQVAYMNRAPEGETIAIYPEIQQGNPFNSKNVVRYMLNKPGVMGTQTSQGFVQGPTQFDPNDKIYVFSKIFDTFGVNKNHILFLPIINLSVFKDYKKNNRTKTCYLIGKGKNLGVHPNDSIELNRRFAQDQQALADLLNECHTLYCYDDLSAMMEVARLCGCGVRYLGNHSKNEMLLYEPGLNGISFPYEDSQLNSDEFKEHYIQLVRAFEELIDQFIEDTQ